jgi:hypothetical protein
MTECHCWEAFVYLPTLPAVLSHTTKCLKLVRIVFRKHVIYIYAPTYAYMYVELGYTTDFELFSN